MLSQQVRMKTSLAKLAVAQQEQKTVICCGTNEVME